MSVSLPRLLRAFLTVPTWSAAEATGVYALARACDPEPQLLRALIARPELTPDQARALAGPALLAAYLGRPDVPAAEVQAALVGLPDHAVAQVGADTAHPAVLEHLAGHPSPLVRHAVAGNPATPTDAAVRALETLGGAGHLLHTALAGVPAGTLAVWAEHTCDLRALTHALTYRRDAPAPAVEAALALAERSPRSPLTEAALRAVLAHPHAGEGARARARAALGPQDPGALALRSWRKATKRAFGDVEAARRLLGALAGPLKGDPDAWAVLATLAAEHTGTVGQLCETATAVAAPAAAAPGAAGTLPS